MDEQHYRYHLYGRLYDCRPAEAERRPVGRRRPQAGLWVRALARVGDLLIALGGQLQRPALRARRLALASEG